MWEVRGIPITEGLAFVVPILVILFFLVPAHTSNERLTLLAIMGGVICAISVLTHEWLAVQFGKEDPDYLQRLIVGGVVGAGITGWGGAKMRAARREQKED
ncbi:MAG: hypothetical protein AAGJ96_00130 [Pseudomonadota bacterium]